MVKIGGSSIYFALGINS